jgi:AraC-like DNA-binding protein
MLWDRRLPGVEALQAFYVRRRYPPHWHESVCVALVTEGTAVLDCARRRHHALASCVFVVPAYEVHTLEVAASAGMQYRALFVGPELIAELLADAGAGGRAAPTKAGTVLEPPTARDLMRDRAAAAEPLAWFHRAMAGRAVPLEREHALLASVVAVASEFGEVHRRAAPDAAHRAVRRARDYLHAHASEPVTLRELAEAAGLSMYRLARTFSAQVGMPPHAYQVRLRVLRSKRLLRAGHSISEVAVSCGFYDQPHLTYQFRRHLGVTPGEYVRGAVR